MIKVSSSFAFANTSASACSSIWSARTTGQAQIPSGMHNSEPRCDMSAKRNPPLP